MQQLPPPLLGQRKCNMALQQTYCSGCNAPPLSMVAMVVAPMQNVLYLCAQGTEDLEEVLSERLQQLPPPLSVHGGGASPIREEGGQDVQPGDELPAEPSKARPFLLSPLSRIPIKLCPLLCILFCLQC